MKLHHAAVRARSSEALRITCYSLPLFPYVPPYILLSIETLLEGFIHGFRLQLRAQLAIEVQQLLVALFTDHFHDI